MISADVFRAPKRDRFGDPVDDDGNPVDITDKDGLAFVGTITDVWMGAVTAGAPTVSSSAVLGSPSRQETSDSNTSLICRRDNGPLPRYGDRIVIENMKFDVKSNPNWGRGHPFSGTDLGTDLYYLDVVARIG